MTDQTLAYATPASRPVSRVAPAVWIALVGLALIGFGGCFLIGVMMVILPQFSFAGTATTVPMTFRVVMFLVVLYAAAFACFGGALLLVFKGVKLLFANLN